MIFSNANRLNVNMINRLCSFYNDGFVMYFSSNLLMVDVYVVTRELSTSCMVYVSNYILTLPINDFKLDIYCDQVQYESCSL